MTLSKASLQSPLQTRHRPQRHTRPASQTFKKHDSNPVIMIWDTEPFSNYNPPWHKWVEILFAAREVELHPIKADISLYTTDVFPFGWCNDFCLVCIWISLSLFLDSITSDSITSEYLAAGKWLGSNVVWGSPMLHGSPGNIATVWVKRLWTASQGGSLKGYRSFALRSYMWQKHLGCFFSYS